MQLTGLTGFCLCLGHMTDAEEISKTILATALKRGHDKSTCPSEIARMLFDSRWRKHMKDVLNTAIGLHIQGKVAITQKGIPVDVQHIKGPVRIKII